MEESTLLSWHSDDLAFEVTPSESSSSDNAETSLLRRLHYYTNRRTIKYPRLLSAQVRSREPLTASPTTDQPIKYHGMKRKREETRTAVHVLVASLTDSQPFITGFQNFYKTFKQAGLEAMFFSIVDFSSTDDKIPVSSITSTNNEPVETTKIQPQKFYITVETPAHMKKRIVECISQKTANAMPDDTVVFIPLGHGIGTGSVLIGSRRTPSIKEYLTIPEIRMAGSNLGRGATFTVVNTA